MKQMFLINIKSWDGGFIANLYSYEEKQLIHSFVKPTLEELMQEISKRVLTRTGQVLASSTKVEIASPGLPPLSVH